MPAKQCGVKEGGTAMALRLLINFGSVPAAWIEQETTSLLVTGHTETRFHRLTNPWKLSAHRNFWERVGQDA